MTFSEKGRQRSVADQLVHKHLAGQLSRRELLTRAGALGVSVPVLTVALGAQRAGANQASPSPAASPSPVAAEDLQLGSYSGQTVRMSIALAEQEAQVYQDVVVAGFQEATGGTIELVAIESADVVRTLEAQVQSGNIQIDLLAQDNNSLAPLVDRDLVEQLSEAEEIMPAETIESIKAVLQFNDQYYFLPARPNVQITYYNSNRFTEYGVEPPTTWDDLMSAAQTIRDAAGVGQLSIQGEAGGAVGVTTTQFIWQAGGDPLMLNTPEAAQAFQFMKDLQPFLTPQYPTATFDTTNTYILNESVVLAQNWPFGVNIIVDEGGKEEVLTYPGWEGPVGNVLVLGGDVFGIAKGTPNRAMALDVAKFFMSRQVQEQLVAQNAWPSMRSDALGAVEDWQTPYFETINEALTFVQPRPNVTYWPDVENILTNAFNDIVTGQAEVEPTLERYQGEIDALTGGA